MKLMLLAAFRGAQCVHGLPFYRHAWLLTCGALNWLGCKRRRALVVEDIKVCQELKHLLFKKITQEDKGHHVVARHLCTWFKSKELYLSCCPWQFTTVNSRPHT